MFKFAAFGRLHFKARELAVETVYDANGERDEDGDSELARGEQESRDHGANGPKKSKLVWPNRYLAQAREQKALDRRMRVSRQILGPFLHGFEQDALGM